jgi:hypothetical protein
LTARQRARQAPVRDAQGQRVAELEREVERLRQRLIQAETIIEVQKAVSLLLGIEPSPPPSAGRLIDTFRHPHGNHRSPRSRTCPS